MTAPVPSGYVPSNAVELAGTATDAIGVAKVGVAVQRLSDKLWLRPDGSFGAYNQQAAVLGSPDGPSTSWALTTELPPGTYGIHAAATDTSGNKSPNSPWRTFTVFTPDDTAPALTMDEPVAGQQYAPGEDVVISGTASDNVGAAYVALGIQRGSDDNWLQPDGTWGPPAYLLAELSSPGATSTGWTYSVALDPDEYAVEAVSLDAAGNISAPTGSRGFEVVAPDTTAPQLSVQAPQEAQEFLAGEAVQVTGTASDGVGVTGVGVSIQRASDDNYLQPDGSWGAAAMLEADLE